MKRFKRFPVLAAFLCAAAFIFSTPAIADTVEIQVSPNTINLTSNGGRVSIHAVISYSAVTQVELAVDGAGVTDFTTFADDRGELVVRIDIDLIKSMLSEGTATFDLVMHTAGGTYTGTDTIRVINRGN
jgi:hypothetical protein